MGNPHSSAPPKVAAGESSWTPLILVTRCRQGAGTFVEHDGLELAVFLLGQEVFVMDNACPHSGGNLSGGEVAEGVVRCPWHHWEFRVADGVCVNSPLAHVSRYPARIRGGWVEIERCA